MADEASADVENQYYMAKGKKEDNPEQALKMFKTIVDNEKEKGDWCVHPISRNSILNYL